MRIAQPNWNSNKQDMLLVASDLRQEVCLKGQVERKTTRSLHATLAMWVGLLSCGQRDRDERQSVLTDSTVLLVATSCSAGRSYYSLRGRIIAFHKWRCEKFCKTRFALFILHKTKNLMLVRFMRCARRARYVQPVLFQPSWIIYLYINKRGKKLRIDFTLYDE